MIDRYFICSPTMMFRRSVIEQLNGYDESLAFEDFDFGLGLRENLDLFIRHRCC
ncbi:MAG: hypothetical protein IPJ20_27470 [Flammeovirgaceae bacterium]|nr:hypothetical protein [Flammeovirgaceae bacterium]